MQKRIYEFIEDWSKTRKVNVDICCYESAEAFLMAWPELQFDLAFLDIQMKAMSGIELANCIRKDDANIQIVFVTSFKQYVLKGYDVNALHYLIKPVSPSKLMPVLDKAHVIWRAHQDSFMLVPDGEGQQKLALGDITHIAISSHTARIHTDERAFDVRKTMSELTAALPSYFVRVHRSYIVNLFKVDCMYKDSLILSSGEKLPISRKSSKAANDAFLHLSVGI